MRQLMPGFVRGSDVQDQKLAEWCTEALLSSTKLNSGSSPDTGVRAGSASSCAAPDSRMSFSRFLRSSAACMPRPAPESDLQFR